jgi:hypothetical protein
VITFLNTARSGVETRAIPLLVDTSAATTSMTLADVDTAVEVVKRALATEGPRGYVALVATDDALFRWALEYEVRCAEIGVRVIRAFRQRADAEKWLTILSTAGKFHG